MGTIDKNILDVLSERHVEWIKMVKSLSKDKNTGISTISNDTASEIVHEMYIKLHKYVKTPERIMYNNDEVNTMFVYVTLRNVYFDSLKKNKRYHEKLEFGHDLYSDEYSNGHTDFNGHVENKHDGSLKVKKYIHERDVIELQDKIKDEINGWEWYNRSIFNVIFYQENSMRSLSRETGISLSSIFNTVKSGKEKLKLKFQEDYNKINIFKR